MATHLYILYLAADESISGWEFFLLIPKSPQMTLNNFCLFKQRLLEHSLRLMKCIINHFKSIIN